MREEERRTSRKTASDKDGAPSGAKKHSFAAVCQRDGEAESKRLRIYSRHKKSKTTPYKVTLDATANAKQVVALKKFASLVLVFRILC